MTLVFRVDRIRDKKKKKRKRKGPSNDLYELYV